MLKVPFSHYDVVRKRKENPRSIVKIDMDASEYYELEAYGGLNVKINVMVSLQSRFKRRGGAWISC